MFKRTLWELAAYSFMVGSYCAWGFYGSLGARNLLVAFIAGIFILVTLGFVASLFTGKLIPRSGGPKGLGYAYRIVDSAFAAVLTWYGHFILAGMYAVSVLVAYLIHESE